MVFSATKSKTTLKQYSCLVGGATLYSLWSEKCGNILNNFVSSFSDDDDVSSFSDDEYNDDNSSSFSDDDSNDDNEDDHVPLLHGSHDWDYMILQDQTQAPAREWSRSISADALRRHYGPLSLLRNQTSSKNSYTIPIVIQTAAYRKLGVMDSDDLGDFHQFTSLLADGAKEYKQALNQVLLENVRQQDENNQFILRYGARVAPVGEGYRLLHDKEPKLWNKLYNDDDFHPSPYGTWLQACIIFITCFRQVPPDYDVNWLNEISIEDAATLRSAACEITGLDC